MDEFKKYISQHRHQLDMDEPGFHLFEQIEKRLNPAKPKVIPMIFKWAAAACIILMAGFGMYKLFVKQSPTTPAIVVSKPIHKIDSSNNLNDGVESQLPMDLGEPDNSVAQVNPKFKPADKQINPGKTQLPKTSSRNDQPVDPMFAAFSEMDRSYATMVSLQIEKVKGTPIYAEDAGYFHVFKKQFQDLTNDEKVLKEETKKNGITDDTISRMISIYQEKISLLKQLQFEINKMNNRLTTTKNDIRQKQKPTYINL